MTVTKEMIEAMKQALVKYSVLMPIDAALSDALSAALSRSAEAGKPVVKGLEWVPSAFDTQYGLIIRIAKTPFGPYKILKGTQGRYEVYFGNAPYSGSMDDEDQAKSWAYSDYEARILSALSTPADIEPVGYCVWIGGKLFGCAKSHKGSFPVYAAPVADVEPVSVPEGAEPVAYASSKEWRKNHLMSAAQYKSALSKNIVDFDIPLYAAADFDRVIAAILADETPVGADDENVALFNRAIDAAKKRVERAGFAAAPQPNPSRVDAATILARVASIICEETCGLTSQCKSRDAAKALFDKGYLSSPEVSLGLQTSIYRLCILEDSQNLKEGEKALVREWISEARTALAAQGETP